MKKTVANVLITNDPIPSDGFISWPQLMEYLLQQYSGNEIDYLICAPSDKPFQSGRTKRIICQVPGRVQNKLFPQRKYAGFAKALKEIATGYTYVIASVWDSAKLQVSLYEALEKEGLEKKVKFLFYNHGFSYFFSPAEHGRFAHTVTEMIMLSKHSYHFDFQRYPAIPYAVQVLYNPINHHLFHPVPPEKKQALRIQKGLDSKVHFLWVGHDKPVKGLSIVIEAWKLFYVNQPNVLLHIIGIDRQNQIPGIQFHGKVLNKDLPEWYQAADIVVFSPLRNEGYGLVLSEAISCGCLAVATWGGGMVEFFEEENGVAIKEPNFLSAWVAGFQQVVEQLPAHRLAHASDHLLPPRFDTYDEWSSKYITIFNQLANRLE